MKMGLFAGIFLSLICSTFAQSNIEIKPIEDQKIKEVQAHKFDPIIKSIEGWNIYIEPALLKSDEGAVALKMLANHLQRIAILLPKEQLKKMRELEIWIESSSPLNNMQYHPSVEWLQENGHDTRLAKKVHIPRADALLSRQQMLKHPAVILHELAHSYHDQHLGFDHSKIIKTYRDSMALGLYDNALLYTGKFVRHYGATNHKEYFAESTESYFYRNDFYPFVAAELKNHDPATYRLMSEIWGPLN